MALFGKDRDRIDRARGVTTDGLVSPVTSAAPPEVEMIERERESGSSGDVGGTSAFLGKGSRVTGKLVFEGTVRIEGHVEGEISAQDTLIIGESAEVNAQITGSSIVVHGRVTGDITARKRLEIRAPGKLFGNITTPCLVIHESCSRGSVRWAVPTPCGQTETGKSPSSPRRNGPVTVRR